MTASPTTQPITLRAASEDDCAVLTTIVRTSAAYPGRYRVMVANQRIDRDYVLANPVRVAADGDEVLGFYSLLVPGCGGAGEGELDFMFVADRHRRRGVGRLLVDDLRRLVADLRLERIHIVSHPPAEVFYLAMGARRAGTIPPAGRVSWSRPYLVLETAGG